MPESEEPPVTAAARGAGGRRWSRAEVLFALLLALATLVAFVPSMLAAFAWDDEYYILENETIQRADGFWRIWLEPFSIPNPYPLVFATYWIEHRLWGLNPFGYHVVNVLLHAANGALLWRALRALRAPGAALAAAVFALHPIHVDSVALAAERKDVLSAFFYLAAILAWVRYREGEARRNVIIALLAFAAAMLAKSVTCTLPVALLVIEWRGGWKSRRGLGPLIPMFILALFFGAATVLWERFRTGASGEHYDFSLAQRCLIAGRACWFYVGKLIWPSSMMILYPRWELDARWAGHWIYPLAAAAATWGLWRARGKIGRDPLAATLLYGVTIAPALGFVNYSTMHYSFVADHYQYLAGAAPIALFCGAIDVAARRMGLWLGRLGDDGSGLRRSAAIAWVAAPAALALLGFLAWRQGETFASVEALWRHNAAKDPRCATAHYDLGLAILEDGRTGEAVAEFLEAARHDPDHIASYLRLARIEEEGGNIERAIRWLEWAARARPRTEKAIRSLAIAHNNLGILLSRQGRREEALARHFKAIEIYPGYAEGINSLGAALHAEGHLAAAAARYRQSIAANPRYALARANLGLALSAMGRTREAIASFEAAVEAAPDDASARARLAGACFAAGDATRAAKEYAEALRLTPGSADLRMNLGAALATLGRLEEAAEHFRKALESRPEDESIKRNLETALEQMKSKKD